LSAYNLKSIHSCVLLLLFVACTVACTKAEEIKAGYADNAPQMFRDSSGRPSGFVVDAINEAAKRDGMDLRWVWSRPSDIAAGLRSGAIDLAPAGVRTPEREQEFHVTKAWWQGHAMILSRTLHQVDDLRGRRIGHTGAIGSAIRQQLPQVTPVRMSSATEMAEAMCRGDLDGILTDRLVVDTLLLNRPPACNAIRLDLVVGVRVTTELGIISRRDRSHAADRLRTQLERMTEDGSLAAIAISYPRISAASAQFVAAMTEQHYRVRTLQSLVAAATLLLGAAALFIWKLRQDLRLRRHAEQELRRRNEDLEQFAYASHHDLREPLRNMAIFSQLLQRKGLSHPDAPEHLSYITSGAARMQDMLDALRNYTQFAILSKGQQATIHSADAVQAAKANLMAQIDAEQGSITAAELPKVHYVMEHLIQVFQNLISNALKYRGKDPPRIHVACRHNEREYVFSVEDNGIGIASEYHEKVFGLFKRLHGREVAGTGIGLAVCRKIIENHGGRLWLESAPGQGSTFYFSVPRNARIQR
jgi:signal transduction histidine kinase